MTISATASKLVDWARVRAVLKTQFLEFRRDFGSVFLSFLFPLFFVMALVAGNLGGGNFTVDFGLVNANASAETRSFAAALASENIHFETLSEEEAMKRVRDGSLSGVVIFPTAAQGGKLRLVTEQRFEGFGKQVVEAARARLLLKDGSDGERFGFTVSSFKQAANSQFAFIYPGMLALALVQLGLFSTAMPLLRARESGTLRFLLLSPLTIPELILGQMALRVGIAACQILLLLFVGSFVIEMSIGQFLAVLGVAVLGVIMLVCIGYMIAGLPRGADSGSAMIMIVNFVMIFSGNIFFNTESATILRILAHLMPVSYLADLFRQIISGNEGIWSPAVDIAAVLGFTALAIAIAFRTFRFDMRGEKPKRAAAQIAPA